MSESRTKRDVSCAHCGNVAPMSVLGRHESHELLTDEDNRAVGEVRTTTEVLLCPKCRRVLVREFEDAPWSNCYDVDWTTLFPAPRRLLKYLPQRLRQAYVAAQRVSTIDPNAYGVLLGRVLEVMCEDRKAQGDSLALKLKHLADQGQIPLPLVEMAHQLRSLRNVGAHAHLGELTRAEIPFLSDLCDAVLEYVYAGPALIAEVASRLERLRKE